jgi:alpha-D-ribose 1-methylphosphonate 5-triphosphate synthase subunit PhnG
LKSTDKFDPAATADGAVKRRLLKVIAAARDDEVEAVLDDLWSSGRLGVRRAPRTGLVMFTVCDPFDTPFHLGEVLVSEAEVECDGHAACGVIAGDAPRKALLLAAVEAVAAGGPAPMLDGLGSLIDRLEARSVREHRRLAKLAAATAVKFESMKRESVDFGSLGNEDDG